MRKNPRIVALARAIECDVTDVSWSDLTFEGPGRSEYLVLTGREATRMAREQTRDSLWAFNTAFLARYVPCLRDTACAKAFDTMRGTLCESAGPLVVGMLGRSVNRCVNDAIQEDGRGHVLSSYDGEEMEAGRYYVYRVN